VRGLPPTSAKLSESGQKPYFLWWTDLTSGELRQKLQEGPPSERAYWLGALLREANTRDVWVFTSVKEITEQWPLVYDHLGKARDLWSFLLRLAPPQRGANAP
jgi:hypothetical protein